MKSKMKFLGLLGILAILFSFSFKSLNTTKTVIIDAGHGGMDAGATFEDKCESKIVLGIANKIYQLNKQKNIKIILLRNTDEFIRLNDRVSKVNEIKPDLLISLHTNSSKDTIRSGIDAFVSKETKENSFYNQSKDIAQSLIEQVSGKNLTQGKVSEANLVLLRGVECPAVMLEVGFLSNKKDRDYITSEEGQTEIATKILETLEND